MHLSYFRLIVVALAYLIINVEGYNECRTECNGRCRAKHCNRNEQESTNPDCVIECDNHNHRLCCVPNVDERKCEDECNGHCRAHKCNKGETLSSNPFCMKDCNDRNGRVCCVDEESDICNVREADSGCGSRVTISESRIVGGQDAQPGEWPWQAQLYYIPVGDEVCGGTLIGPRHVVSAAHCFFDSPINPDAWIVRLGRYTRGNPPSPADDESIEVGVQEIIRHSEFNGTHSFDDDIALIILDQDVSATDFINYACLDDDVTFYEDSCCYITGWGTLEFFGDQSNILQEAVVPILSNDTCITSYGSYVTENMVCAGYLTGGIDACQGDSGGPLVCIHTDTDTGISRWHLAGITSWGFECALPGYPGVYTRVSKYYEWLQDHGVPF